MLTSTLAKKVNVKWHFFWYARKVVWFVSCNFTGSISLNECSRFSKSQTRMTSWLWERSREKQKRREKQRRLDGLWSPAGFSIFQFQGIYQTPKQCRLHPWDMMQCNCFAITDAVTRGPGGVGWQASLHRSCYMHKYHIRFAYSFPEKSSLSGCFL